MTRTPIPNCPQEDKPIRDRAWTAEQAIANLLDCALDAAAFLNAIKRNDRAEPLREAVHAVWPESAKSMDARFHLSSAFAATLCQQAEQPAVAVSGWDGEAYANMAGELESWKRRALQAEHFIEHEVQGQTFMGEPLLRAPAEQGGRVDEGMSIDLALGYAKAACIGPMSSQAIAVIESALAQNAQGEDRRSIEHTLPHQIIYNKVARRFLSVHREGKGWGYEFEYSAGASYGYETRWRAIQSAHQHALNEYLRAERARVPDVDAVVSRFLGWRLPADFAPDGGVSFNPPSNPLLWPTGTCLLNDPQATAMFEYLLAAAPSQPEDAA